MSGRIGPTVGGAPVATETAAVDTTEAAMPTAAPASTTTETGDRGKALVDVIDGVASAAVVWALVRVPSGGSVG